MFDIKITKDRLKNHLHYSKWMYVFLVAAAMIIFSLIYTVTAPKTPKELKIDIAVINYSIDTDEAELWSQEILAVLPEDQLEVNIFTVGTGSSGGNSEADSSLIQIITARLLAKEDDIYILDKDTYSMFASEGVFLALDDLIEKYGYLSNLDLAEYRVELSEKLESDGMSYIYGIPLNGVLGLYDLGIDPENSVIALLAHTENYENDLIALDYILSRTESVRLGAGENEGGQ